MIVFCCVCRNVVEENRANRGSKFDTNECRRAYKKWRRQAVAERFRRLCKLGRENIMKAIFLMLACAGICAAQGHYRHEGPALLNDLRVTPGAASAIPQATLCSKSFHTGSVRDVDESVKRKVYEEYGAVEKKGACCEVDHLISLELGGSNDIKNLWPQPYLPRPGAHEKDKLENYLHEQVCAGSIGLAEAQREISTDWYGAYKVMSTTQNSH